MEFTMFLQIVTLISKEYFVRHEANLLNGCSVMNQFIKLVHSLFLQNKLYSD